MALCMYQVAYTAEAVAALIKDPQDRVEAVRPALEAEGGKVLAYGYPFGEYDALVVYEAPDDTVAASFALAVAAGGAAQSGKTTRLPNGPEAISALPRGRRERDRPPGERTPPH